MLPAPIALARPAQWAKNVFVLAPILFARRLDDPAAVGRALIAFGCFCLAASAVYCFNDIRDRHRDRKHPIKRLRPVAAGTISVGGAAALAAVLAAAALVGSAALGPVFAAYVGAYLVLQALYTLVLKRVVILDVMMVSVGFVLRVLAGGVAIPVEVSAWLVLCTIFLALFLVFAKRRHELLVMEEPPDRSSVLSHYSPEFLDQMINVVTASSVIAYALYAIDDDTVGKYGTGALIYTVPLVLFGIFRFLYLTYQRPERHNPTHAILSDGPFLLNLAIWAAAVIWIVYGG